MQGCFCYNLGNFQSDELIDFYYLVTAMLAALWDLGFGYAVTIALILVAEQGWKHL